MVAPVAPCGGQQEREQEDGAAHRESHVSNNTCKRPACACVKPARDLPVKGSPGAAFAGHVRTTWRDEFAKRAINSAASDAESGSPLRPRNPTDNDVLRA